MISASGWRTVFLSPHAFIVYSVLLGSANNVIGRAIVDEMPPFTLSAIRFLTAVIALVPLALPALMRQREVFLRHWKFMVVMSVLGISVYNPAVYYALRTTTAVNASLLSASMPVICLLLSWLFFRERATWLRGLGIVVSLVGVLATVTRGDPALLISLQINEGDLLVLVGLLSWCVFTVNLRRLPAGLDPFAFMQVTMVIGLLAMSPLVVLELENGPTPNFSTDNIVAVLYLGIGVAVGAYYCWNRGVAGVGATVAAQYAYLSPIYASLLAVIFLGEAVHGFHLVSIVLIFLGIFLSTRPAAESKTAVP
ncbi:MAG: DMT family transporter [Alphaproteobacteria bacterium]|nr:DMT family transporter [Alphaproteobacteria bacterium]